MLHIDADWQQIEGVLAVTVGSRPLSARAVTSGRASPQK
jgi:hypothetical protein